MLRRCLLLLSMLIALPVFAGPELRVVSSVNPLHLRSHAGFAVFILLKMIH